MSAKRMWDLSAASLLSNQTTRRSHLADDAEKAIDQGLTRRRFITLTAGSAALLGTGGTAIAAAPAPIDLSQKPMPRLQPGIVVGEETKFGYSTLVTLVLPRLASGDIASLPDFAKRYAGMFKLVILANIVERKTPKQTVYLLDKIGCGFAMDISGKMTIVTKDTANQLGANLGMIDRGVLGGNEDCLDDVIQVARTNRLVVFDAESNMLINGKHEQRLIRHFIWASPASGELGFLIWQLQDTSGDNYAVDSKQMQLLPQGFKEDRKIHVSEGNFFSSKIPTPDRFALESVPSGTPVPFSERMLQVAGRKTLTPRDLENLLTGASESLAMLQVPAVAKKQ